MRSQTIAKYGLIIKLFSCHLCIPRMACLLFVASALFQVCYASLPPAASQPGFLDNREKSYIYSLSNNAKTIPAWLIAQLLESADRLHQSFINGQLKPAEVQINDLLAEPDKYQAKVIVLKAIFASSSNVNEQLQLPAGEQCWSILLLDVKYHKAIQLFTSQDPARFQKSQAVYAVGIFLTNRLDQPEKESESQAITVPVVMGSIFLITTKSSRTDRGNYFHFLTSIIFLTLIYIFVRIILAKLQRKKRLSLYERIKGKE